MSNDDHGDVEGPLAYPPVELPIVTGRHHGADPRALVPLLKVASPGPGELLVGDQVDGPGTHAMCADGGKFSEQRPLRGARRDDHQVRVAEQTETSDRAIVKGQQRGTDGGSPDLQNVRLDVARECLELEE